MARVKLERVTKRFGTVVAVDNVTLGIEDGELFTFLGPSGCGKTTTLRVIAGFEIPDNGRVYIDNDDVTFKKPYERDCAMVFQNYALWPHMTVFDNVAYGLKVRRKRLKLTDEEIRKRVLEVLELVGLRGLENRYPLQLSGGQQQRVALARALVVQPKVLLLDEPLSNLDAKLRLRMREEIKKLQKQLGITTIYVTHDQEEAMSISDRIAIMNRGKVLQVGKPIDVYNKPTNLFVATFIGRSSALRCKIIEKEPSGYLKVVIGNQVIRASPAPSKTLSPGSSAVAIMKPEDVKLGMNDNVIRGIARMSLFLGPHKQLIIYVADQRLTAYIDPEIEIEPNSEVILRIRPDEILVFPEEEWEEVKLEEI